MPVLNGKKVIEGVTLWVKAVLEGNTKAICDGIAVISVLLGLFLLLYWWDIREKPPK
jgi:hypothetical protein